MRERLSEGYALLPLGDSGLLIKLGDRLEEATHRQVAAVLRLLEAGRAAVGFRECVPAYASVAVHYDPYAVWRSRSPAERQHRTLFETMCARVRKQLRKLDGDRLREMPARTVHIPVCYGGAFGPDLEEVAAHGGLTAAEVVALHSGATYLVHMIGFAPGFPYLGGMPEAIATPRRSSPRMSIPAGSVGIGGAQTGIYPVSTPGGWRIIGRTPLALFRPDREAPSLLRAGDYVRFYPIAKEQYERYCSEERVEACE